MIKISKKLIIIISTIVISITLIGILNYIVDTFQLPSYIFNVIRVLIIISVYLHTLTYLHIWKQFQYAITHPPSFLKDQQILDQFVIYNHPLQVIGNLWVITNEEVFVTNIFNKNNFKTRLLRAFENELYIRIPIQEMNIINNEQVILREKTFHLDSQIVDRLKKVNQ